LFWAKQIETRQNLKSHQEANLVLQNREARDSAPSSLAMAGENHWAALRAAHQKVSEIGFSLTMVWLYNQARTYFSKNF